MIETYHVGFFNQVHDKPLYSYDAKYTDVYDICRSDNGKVIAFATSKNEAVNIVNALNEYSALQCVTQQDATESKQEAEAASQERQAHSPTAD